MNIDQTLTGLRSYIAEQGGLPHLNRYAVEMTKPLSMTSNPEYTKVLNKLIFSARMASIPSKTISTNAVMAAGPEQKYPYADVYDNLSITFLVTKGKGVGLPERKFFEDWMGTVVNESNMLVGFSTGKNAYGVDLFLSGLSDVRGKTSRYVQYKFDRTYPIAISEIKFSSDSHELMWFSVTFSYDRFVRTENIEDNQPNPKSALPPEKPKKAEDADRKLKPPNNKKEKPIERIPKEFAKKKDAPLADREPKEGWDNFKKTEPEKFGPPSPKDIRIVGSQAPSVPTPKKFTQKLKTRATNLVKAKLGIRPMLDE